LIKILIKELKLKLTKIMFYSFAWFESNSSIYTNENVIRMKFKRMKVHSHESINQKGIFVQVVQSLVSNEAQEANVPVVQLTHETSHNICAYLDSSTKHAREFEDIIHFLLRSRISYAIATKYDAHREHLQDFWSSAATVFVDGNPFICATVQGNEFMMNDEDIRRICHFGDDLNARGILNKYLVRGFFLRMKYDGNINEGVLNKSNVCP
ncbi:MAG: hypothetical protein Q8874_02515, partial [Sweet potato little leaf phytoplasma]|nr:hypothetical protein [Sweet potato little leaf phytoplasma]